MFEIPSMTQACSTQGRAHGGARLHTAQLEHTGTSEEMAVCPTPPYVDLQKYASPLGALQGIIKEEGVSALFRGLPLTCAKQGPSQAVLFLAFDSFKGVLDVQDK